MKVVILDTNKGKEEVPYYISDMAKRHFALLEGNADFIELLKMEMFNNQMGLTNLFKGKEENAEGFFIDHQNKYSIYHAWMEKGKPKGIFLYDVNLKLPDKTHSWLFSLMVKAIGKMRDWSREEEKQFFYHIVINFTDLITHHKDAP